MKYLGVFIPVIALTGLSGAGAVQSENWAALAGREVLREFVSGATVEILVKPGVVATGEYRADGTATITVWDETFDRTWEVRGDDEVCYSSATETNCYTFEQNLGSPGEYRARHVGTGEMIVFRVMGTDPRVLTRESRPGSEGGPGTPSAGDIAAALSNPNTTMGTLNTLFDVVAYGGDLPGAGSQRAVRATFQPSLPYPLSETTNLFVRPAIPVIFSQDVPNLNGDFESKGVALGDMSFDALVGKTFKKGVVAGGGIVGTLPTATDEALGLDQWLLGPEGLFAMVRRWGVLGLLVTHQWDVAGDNESPSSITGGQYFDAFNLHNGWQINGSPVYSYNHHASEGNAWSFPLAFGVSKTSILGGRPWKFNVQYWHYVVSPDTFGPQHQIRIGISPVVALPW